MWALRPAHAPLVGERTGSIVASVEGWRAVQKGHGLGGAAVIGKHTEQRGASEGRAAGAILDQIIGIRRDGAIVNTIPTVRAVRQDGVQDVKHAVRTIDDRTSQG